MKKLFMLTFVFLLAACNKHPDTVVIVSANAEWKALAKIVRPADGRYNQSPYGNWFEYDMDGRKIIFFHGGWGKIDAAGSAQYVINKFNPRLIINLGTAGGFPGKVNKGDIILVNRAITYDIYEKMGDSDEAIAYYTSPVSTPPLPLNNDIRISPIVSADQDLVPGRIDSLYKKYGASAGDWESSAIAHVAGKNKVKCYIIRGITDIVYQTGSETYGNYDEFEKGTLLVMDKLVKYLKIIIENENRAGGGV